MKLIRYHNSPSHYNPASSYAGLRHELDSLFDLAFPAFSAFQSRGLFDDRQDTFPIDLYQDKEAYNVRAELPGFRKEDLSVEVIDGTLTITGHQKTESDKTNKEAAVTTQERSVTRSISLPEQVKTDKIQARYENGVLTMTVPKREEVKPKQIAIEVK